MGLKLSSSSSRRRRRAVAVDKFRDAAAEDYGRGQGCVALIAAARLPSFRRWERQQEIFVCFPLQVQRLIYVIFDANANT